MTSLHRNFSHVHTSQSHHTLSVLDRRGAHGHKTRVTLISRATTFGMHTVYTHTHLVMFTLSPIPSREHFSAGGVGNQKRDQNNQRPKKKNNRTAL